MAVMEIDEIQQVLPHRYPFLLVDRVVECDFQTRIVAIKNLTGNEWFFQGHFPGRAVMPGVLQLEALAQTGGILLNRLLKKEGQIAYFLSIDNAKFRKILRPGDQMRLEVTLLKIRMGMSRVHGRVLVDGELACEADLMFGNSDG